MTLPVATHGAPDATPLAPPPENLGVDAELHAIFAARAHRLAQPVVQHIDDASLRQVLIVLIAGERYAIDSRHVVEVQATGRIVPVPGLGEQWRGLVNVRGRLYATLDLGRFLAQLHLHTPGAAPRSEGRFVLTRSAGLTIALFVDEVQSVRQVAESAVLPPLAGALEGERTPVIGLTDDLVVLLDVDALFQLVRGHASVSGS